MEAEQQQDSERTKSVWLRGLIMLFFMVAFGLGQTILNIIAIIQFLWLLIAGETNQFLARFGTSLSKWFSEVIHFLTCANNERPFPWREWPPAD